MIYEIRHYHYEPSAMAAYRQWAVEKALPYIRAHVDHVGFWTNIDEAPQVGGKPIDELGVATVTWVIRWKDIETRHRMMGEVFGSDEWRTIFAALPTLPMRESPARLAVAMPARSVCP